MDGEGREHGALIQGTERATQQWMGWGTGEPGESRVTPKFLVFLFLRKDPLGYHLGIICLFPP